MGADDSTIAIDARVDEERLHCPLCEYDLRGLSEPRCPECGYQFVWAELRDRKRNTHPYLFEHYPRNNVWSFFRTAVAGLRPRRFWKTLRPQNTPHPLRLILYWIIGAGLPALLAITLISSISLMNRRFPPPTQRYVRVPVPVPVSVPVPFAPQSYGYRSASSAASRPTFVPFVPGYFAYQPLPLGAPQPSLVRALNKGTRFAPVLLWSGVLIVIWTLCTHAALLIFQESMARARIMPIHVARCVYYSFDVAMWLGLVGCGLMTIGGFSLPIVPPFFILLGMLLLIHAIFRLNIAYRTYLQFEHSFWVVLSSQAITFLAIVLAVVTFDENLIFLRRW